MTNQQNGGSQNEEHSEQKDNSILFDDLCWEVLEKVRAKFVVGDEDSFED